MTDKACKITLRFSVFSSRCLLLVVSCQGFYCRVYLSNGMVICCWLLGVGCRMLVVDCRVIAAGGCILFLVIGYRLLVGCCLSVSAVTRCPQLRFFGGGGGGLLDLT